VLGSLGHRGEAVTSEAAVIGLDLDQVGDRLGRFRLQQPGAERAMAASLRRYGQVSPVVVFVHAGQYELVDGFKRRAALREVGQASRVTARVLETDQKGAKVAMLLVDHQDFTTTIREHVRAFEDRGGAATVCLYDSMKVVVHFWEGEQPVYNPRFLAFCFHYGYRAWACKRRRPRTKGKVEEPFKYVTSNLLNARSFVSRDDLNAFTREVWLPKVDLRPHDTTKRPPLELWEQERPQLLPLPDHPYDTAEVFYRCVGPEWHVPYRQNSYSVPWTRIGQWLPVRVTEAELILYGPDLCEIVRHALADPGRNEKRTLPEHAPGADEPRRYELLRERFVELGEQGPAFLEGLVRGRRYGKEEAHRVLGLLATYEHKDLIAAIERACRYRAYSLTAIERILTAQGLS